MHDMYLIPEAKSQPFMMSRCPKYKGLSEGYDSAENAENILSRFPWGGRLGLVVSCNLVQKSNIFLA